MEDRKNFSKDLFHYTNGDQDLDKSDFEVPQSPKKKKKK